MQAARALLVGLVGGVGMSSVRCQPFQQSLYFNGIGHSISAFSPLSCTLLDLVNGMSSNSPDVLLGENGVSLGHVLFGAS